jgi:hypothetical protein
VLERCRGIRAAVQMRVISFVRDRGESDGHCCGNGAAKNSSFHGVREHQRMAGKTAIQIL